MYFYTDQLLQALEKKNIDGLTGWTGGAGWRVDGKKNIDGLARKPTVEVRRLQIHSPSDKPLYKNCIIRAQKLHIIESVIAKKPRELSSLVRHYYYPRPPGVLHWLPSAGASNKPTQLCSTYTYTHIDRLAYKYPQQISVYRCASTCIYVPYCHY